MPHPHGGLINMAAGRSARRQLTYRQIRAGAQIARWAYNRRYAQRAWHYGGQFAKQAYDWYNKPGVDARRSHPLGASIHYKKPPRTKLVKGYNKLSKKEKAKLYRQRVKFPISASVKVIMGNQTPPGGTSSPLAAQWTRSTSVATPTGADAAINLCGFVVALTKQTNLKVGQDNIAANTSGPSSGSYAMNNLLYSIKSDSSQMNGEAHNYICTGLRAQSDSDYLVAGVRGSITIGGMQQSTDQRVYCQIVRAFNAPHQVDVIDENYMKELVNAQSLPNNQHWQQLWRHSFVLKGRATGSARISQKNVNFNLPLNYKRSKTKKVSTAASQVTYGTQLGYAYENTEEMYNTLYLVITSRALNTTAQEAIDTLNTTTNSTHPDVEDGGGRMNPKIGIKGYVQTFYKYRNSQVAPGSTLESGSDED